MMLAWHYTTGQKFRLIADSKVLLPAVTGVEPPEKAILWFSLNQYWEQTANKAWQEPGQSMRRLNMRETFELAGGLVRFGCPLRKLRTGEVLRKEARMKSAVWKSLVAEGIRQGAKPAEWWGIIKALPIEGLGVEVMNDSMTWERVSTCSL